MNNASFLTADRTTHLKIVVLALVASIGVMGVAIAARTGTPDLATARIEKGVPMKAGKVVFSATETTAVR